MILLSDKFSFGDDTKANWWAFNYLKSLTANPIFTFTHSYSQRNIHFDRLFSRRNGSIGRFSKTLRKKVMIRKESTSLQESFGGTSSEFYWYLLTKKFSEVAPKTNIPSENGLATSLNSNFDKLRVFLQISLNCYI